MARQPSIQICRPVGELIEESIALLRRTPVGALIAYYVGAVPFWLSLLYFISDMSRGGYAAERLLPGSLAVGALFLWMKCWHCVFTSRLRAALLLRSEKPWNAPRIARMAVTQTSIHSWGLIVRYIASVIVFPMVWVSSFYHSATVLGDGVESEGSSTTSRAWQQARLWPKQAHGLALWLGLLWIFVFADILVTLFRVPGLLKTLFGVETVMSRDLMASFNSTTLSAGFALTVMCLDPLWKAAYVLRCFYGESLRTGEDLRLQLRGIRARAQELAPLILAIAGVLLTFHPASAAEQTAPPPPAASKVDPDKLSRSIEDTLNKREYTWRVPRPQVKEDKKTEDSLEETIRKIRKWIRDHLNFGKSHSGQEESASSSGASFLPMQGILYGLLVVAAALLVYGGWRAWRGRIPAMIAAQARPAMPNLEAEDVAPDALPEDEWLQFARSLLEKGDLRLALRAAYLAGLANLGQRELLTIARHKSNMEYDRELKRRARTREELVTIFEENLAAFERSWYGNHQVTQDGFTRFTANLERMRAC